MNVLFVHYYQINLFVLFINPLRLFTSIFKQKKIERKKLKEKNRKEKRYGT